MTSNWREDLIKRCPRLFPEPVPWGLDVGDGWQSLLEELCVGLEEHLKTLPHQMLLNDDGTRMRIVAQVKEKYGGLRFYTSITDDVMDRLIEKAERKSTVTCEVCGKPGTPRRISWVETLCDECNEARHG